jgi:hypothetical protein
MNLKTANKYLLKICKKTSKTLSSSSKNQAAPKNSTRLKSTISWVKWVCKKLLLLKINKIKFLNQLHIARVKNKHSRPNLLKSMILTLFNRRQIVRAYSLSIKINYLVRYKEVAERGLTCWRKVEAY